jgi:hypothetical protein
MCVSVQTRLEHPSLQELMAPYVKLEEQVKEKALRRLKFDELERCDDLVKPTSKWFQKPLEYALQRYSYFRCFKCQVSAVVDAARARPHTPWLVW